MPQTSDQPRVTPLPANLGVYVINLDRATERMQQMNDQMEKLGVPYTRVSAVLGDLLEEPIKGFSEKWFQIHTGKRKNKREIGCYFSHIKVMESFLQTSDEYALILEDDAGLPDYLLPLLEATIVNSDQWDLLRLSSSREGNYIKLKQLIEGHSLVVNTRVLKNTAAYVINRHAAKRCLEHLQPMEWPYDVALDRDWKIGIRTACITPFPVTLSDMPGQIPKAPRVKLLRATTYHLFHIIDHFLRRRYRKQCVRNSSHK